ncbi:MAG: class 1 fructose-bisphosphatase [Chloroflexi bacterium]|nr:MAG: fructose-bisphosphatase class I [Anaerolineaceae bacterium 4572_32.2]RLC81652.1 MAG: class 1 fructose-bisphosphatase [Chloroflexota bacterium]RLC87457.1 MAG: class 1 fructose-bisphosphatase [Chloroflexota bacterium]HEY72668.1 class 1 fructose-bisphosphatase [Thermoflexia bacterium]
MPDKIITIERHIVEQQRAYPEATGVLSSLLYDVALAAKIIARETTRAGLVEILGLAGKINVQGEEQMKLDIFANEMIIRMNSYTGRLAVMASEEMENIITVPEEYEAGKYVAVFDPLDGSSNIDVNVSIGTIIGIYHRLSTKGPGTLEDCLQKGRQLAAACYVIYGASTMMVYTTGNGVHGFTLDCSIGEFLLSHPNIRVPAKPKYYSVNHGHEQNWSPGVKQFTRWLQGLDQETARKPLSSRYIGSSVADFHRNLLKGGIFYYPADAKRPQGKLRLLYEAIPLAFINEHAGGYASDGHCNILDIQPESLHQRTPLFVGNRELVEQAEKFISRYDK